MSDFSHRLVNSLEPRELELAGLSARSLAFLLDGGVLGAIGMLNGLVVFGALYFLLKVTGVNLHSGTVQSLSTALLNGVSFLLNLLIGWLYYALMESSEAQATVGKMVAQLRVTGKDGSRLSFARASARFWARMAHIFVLSMLGVLIGGVFGGLFLAVSELAAIAIIFGVFVGLLFGGMAGYLPALFTARRQTLHDLMAGTVVVKAD